MTKEQDHQSLSLKKSYKTRIDLLLVERGLVSTRQRAQSMILAGHILVNNSPIVKAGQLVNITVASIKTARGNLRN